MNTYIRNIIKRIFPKELPKPLGRWKVENTNKQMNHKIDLSNEDHCGPCGQYALSKTKIHRYTKPPSKNSIRTTDIAKNK